jgi:Sulfotransferase domain
MRTAADSPPDPGAVRGRIPDFFIVGHHKSGTTALYEMLIRHPEIYMSDIKEPRFLAADMRPRFTPPRGRRLPQTLEEYLSLFAQADPRQRAGEASPSYLLSHTAADQISQLQPAARIIAILREPASFLYSLHLQLLRSHVESERDLLKAISLEGARSEGRGIPRRSHLPQLLQYSEHVRYVDQLRRYHERFPPEQVLVLIYEDFRDDNEGTLRAVLRFLEVDEDYPIEKINVKQTISTMRSQQIDDLLLSLTLGRSSVSRRTRAALKALAPRRLRREALGLIRRRAVLAPAAPPEEATMLELRRRFQPEVASLSEYLGRDLLARWGY